MSPTSEPVPRARRPWSWLAGILTLGVLSGGVVAVALLLWDYVDIQALTRSPQSEVAEPLPDPLAPGAAARPPEVRFDAFVYRSSASAGYFPDGDFYPSVLEQWRELLQREGAEVAELASASAVAALDGTGLVAVPAAICLEEAEVAAFADHVGRGGGLLLTWATGARDAACEWRGWDPLRELTGARDVRQIEERGGTYLTIPGGLPLSQGIEPAARIEMRWDAQVALAVDGPRVYWADWALNPAPAEGAEGVDVAAHLQSFAGGGRVAWFGFNGSEAVTPLDEGRIEVLLGNGTRWAAAVPSAELLAWPDRRQAAFAFVHQAGWEFENARNIAELASSRDFPVTFFAASRRALDHPELAELLAGAGEVGSQSPDDQVLAGAPAADQRTRLDQSRTQVRGWTGVDARGLRPPEERFDAATLGAWRELGGSYVVGINNGRTGSPEILDTEHGPIVLLPRVIKDDYNVLVQDRTMRRDALAGAFGEGIQKLHVLGGLALVTTHSQLAGAARHIEAIGDVLDAVQEQDDTWWAATGSEIANWMLARRAAEVSFGTPEDGRFGVEVVAGPDAPLTRAWLGIATPPGGPWEPWVEGEPVEFASTGWGVAVAVPDLDAGESWGLEMRSATAPVAVARRP